MSEGLGTEFLKMPLLANEIPRRLDKKMIASVSIIFIVGCVVATACILSAQDSYGQGFIELSSFEESRISSWNSTEHATVSKLLSIRDAKAYTINFSDDGRFLVYTNDKCFTVVVDLEVSSVLFELKISCRSRSQIDVSPDRNTVAIISDNRYINFIDANTKLLIASYEQAPNSGYITRVRFTKHSKEVIFVNHHKAFLWNLESLSIAHKFEFEVSALKLSEDRSLILNSSKNRLEVWDIEKKERVFYYEGNGNIRHDAISHDNRYIAFYELHERDLLYSDQVNTLKVIDFTSGQILLEKDIAIHAQILSFSEDSKYLALGNSKRSYYIVDLSTMTQSARIETKETPRWISFSKDNRYIVSLEYSLLPKDQGIEIFDLNELKSVGWYQLGNSLKALGKNKDGDLILAIYQAGQEYQAIEIYKFDF